MHAGALRALEFDRIVEAVRGFRPDAAGRGASRRARAGDRPAGGRVGAGGDQRDRPVSRREPDRAPGAGRARRHPRRLAVEGRALEPLHLLALATFLASVDTTCGAIRRARASFPILSAIAERAASFEHEIADVRRKIDPAGEVVDDATPELRSIRDRLRKQRARLRGTLESYLRGKDTAKYLQQQIVTDRNGRYVLVVRAEHRAAIPGIVHGSSGSGASLFLEPLSTVEINNDIVALEQQEAEEVRRILLALTDAFRGRAEDLERTVEAATELDVPAGAGAVLDAGRRGRAGTRDGRTARAARRRGTRC